MTPTVCRDGDRLIDGDDWCVTDLQTEAMTSKENEDDGKWEPAPLLEIGCYVLAIGEIAVLTLFFIWILK